MPPGFIWYSNVQPVSVPEMAIDVKYNVLIVETWNNGSLANQ